MLAMASTSLTGQNALVARVQSPVARAAPLHRGIPRLHRARQQQRPGPVSVAASASDLATYSLYPRHSSAVAPWFHSSICEVVRHLENSPFLQLVRFNQGDRAREPKFTSFGVSDSVVAAPELWESIAETLSADTADVVILVQRVEATHHHEEPESTLEAPMLRHSSNEMREHVEDACRRLVASGVGESILQGQVGDCCEEEGKEAAQPSTTPSRALSSGIVPYSSRSGARAAVKVTALPSGGCGADGATPLGGYWGVVVQSRHHTGAEGCYLLKAVRTVPSARGRGLASRILAGLAAHAAAQGVRRVFLQVEDDNPVAQGLYGKAGFETAWRYHYWRVTEIPASA